VVDIRGNPPPIELTSHRVGNDKGWKNEISQDWIRLAFVEDDGIETV
jgi:hypothetical protein